MQPRVLVCWCLFAVALLLTGCGASEKDFEKEVAALEAEVVKVKGDKAHEDFLVKASLLHERIRSAMMSKSIDATKATQLNYKVEQLMMKAGEMKNPKKGGQ